MTQFQAPFATRPEDSRGRLFPEEQSRRRTCFQRDRDRIIHSTAFRRLKHKTQVFISPHGDHFRTRLTHSIEVAQIARSMSRSLGLDEDLTEALALAHDFGHPPFGHAGEAALNDVMKPYGGFDHNEQTLRILTSLEQRYATFDGLNLTWETLEGVVKHNGPLLRGATRSQSIPRTIIDYCKLHDLELNTHAGPEAQVAAIADDIAYDNHDIDDGLRAGAFAISDFADVPHVADAFARVRSQYPAIEEGRAIFEAVRSLIGDMVEDVLRETGRRLEVSRPKSVGDVRLLERPIVAFSEDMQAKDRALKDFLFRHMYRHRDVMREVNKAKRVVKDLFVHFMKSPADMPEEWRRLAEKRDEASVGRVVADYIAGMTDNYALKCHDMYFKVDARV
jgi:dGTPase